MKIENLKQIQKSTKRVFFCVKIKYLIKNKSSINCCLLFVITFMCFQPANKIFMIFILSIIYKLQLMILHKIPHKTEITKLKSCWLKIKIGKHENFLIFCLSWIEKQEAKLCETIKIKPTRMSTKRNNKRSNSANLKLKVVGV